MAFKTRNPACPLSGTCVHTVISCSDVRKQLLSRRRLFCKFSGQYFRVDSYLILQISPYCNCSTEHILPISRTENSEFCKVFEGSLKECYVLWLPCHRDCWNVLHDMVVSTKCYIQTVMINVNFREHGILMPVLIQLFHRCVDVSCSCVGVFYYVATTLYLWLRYLNNLTVRCRNSVTHVGVHNVAPDDDLVLWTYQSLTHCGRVTQICIFTLQLCRTGDTDLCF
jgi:hypothetical protein